MCWQASSAFGCDSRAPGDARRFITAQLTGVLADQPERSQLVVDAVLIVSELVTDSVNASCDRSVLRWTGTAASCGSVSGTAGAGWPTVQSPVLEYSQGRGLAIRAALATAWGARRLAPVSVCGWSWRSRLRSLRRSAATVDE
jgi:hypothetical protein